MDLEELAFVILLFHVVQTMEKLPMKIRLRTNTAWILEKTVLRKTLAGCALGTGGISEDS